MRFFYCARFVKDFLRAVFCHVAGKQTDTEQTKKSILFTDKKIAIRIANTS